MGNAEVEFEKRISKFVPVKESWTPIDKALFTQKTYFKNYQKTADLTIVAIKYSYRKVSE